MRRPVEKLKFDRNIYNTIRKNIKIYRRKRNMTSEELSELIDVSHDFIRKIESEKVASNFSLETFYKISVALDVTMDDLSKKN